MSAGEEVRLYDLLPAYIRMRDVEEGQHLAVLMNALQGPFDRLRADIGALYRAWFIETCAPWQVPYIGDLLGLPSKRRSWWLPSLRSRVANTIAYRRAKGTAVALERVAADVAGWPCHAGAARPTLVRTASVAFAGTTPGSVSLAGLGRTEVLEGPWRTVGRTVAVGPHPPTPRLGDDGRRNLTETGLAFWRVRGYPVYRAELRPLTESGERATLYHLHPLGVDTPVVAHPSRPTEVMFRTAPEDVPRALDAATFAVARAHATADADQRGGTPLFRAYLRRREGGPLEPVPDARVRVARLPDGTWPLLPLRRPDAARADVELVLDPARGRLVLIGERPHAVLADYNFGGVMDLGGGVYPRTSDLPVGQASWRAVVAADGAASDPGSVAPRTFPSLAAALDAWNRVPHAGFPVPPAGGWTGEPPPTGVIVIADSAIHRLPAQTPVNVRHRSLMIVAAPGFRPAIEGGLAPVGPERREAASAGDGALAGPSERPSRLRLEGLWIGGAVTPRGAPLVEIRHALLRPTGVEPTGPAVAAEHAAEGAELEIAFSICGSIRLGPGSRLMIRDSIVQGSDAAIEGGFARVGGSRLDLERTTVLGGLRCGELVALDTLFDGEVNVARPEAAGLRFCSLPASRALRPVGSVTGRPPIFLSVRYGDLGYARLAPNAPETIASGGTDGEEIGVYHGVGQRARLADLGNVLRSYLPSTQTAQVTFET